MWAGIPKSVRRLATGFTAWGSNPSEGEISCALPYCLWGPPSLLYNGYRVICLWVKRPGAFRLSFTPHQAPRLKEE